MAEKKLHPWPLRVLHWINAAAIIILIGSGWQIYDDEQIFGFLYFPHEITIGGDHDLSVQLHGNGGYSGALQWHFLAMWILAINGIIYLTYGLATGRFRRKLLPLWPRQIVTEAIAALTFRLKHDDITHYNAVQRAMYVGVILIGIVQVLSGLAIWKPVQFQDLLALFHDFQTARLVHFLGMAAIGAFVVVHVALAFLVPKTIAAMITGGPKVQTGEKS
jgi:thiosulfate reductase cytochrome b subunit